MILTKLGWRFRLDKAIHRVQPNVLPKYDLVFDTSDAILSLLSFQDVTLATPLSRNFIQIHILDRKGLCSCKAQQKDENFHFHLLKCQLEMRRKSKSLSYLFYNKYQKNA